MAKIVFDIGGTNMRVARAENGVIQNVLKMPTPRESKEGLGILVQSVQRLSGDKTESLVGGMAGLISREGKVLRSSNLPGWENYDLAGYLKKDIGADVSIYNDALLAGLGEATYGAGKGVRVVAYIGVGTGIGGSRIVNKSLDSMGFEPGHHIIDLSSGESWGQKISGRALSEKHGKLVSGLERGEYDGYVGTIAAGVYNAMLFWSPDIVVLGGALMNKEDGFKVTEVAQAVSKLNKVFPTPAPIVGSELGDEAGLYGAMALLD